RVNQFYVTQCARRLFDLPGYPFIAFAADSRWPIDRCVCADFGFPLRTDFTQVISPNVSSPTAVRPMHDHDLLVGQFCPCVERRDLRVAPLFDLTEKNSRNG